MLLLSYKVSCPYRSSTKPKDLSAAKTTEQQFKEDRDVGKAEPEQTVVELCPELKKIERLLTKVQKVRSTVKDEVRDTYKVKKNKIQEFSCLVTY